MPRAFLDQRPTHGKLSPSGNDEEIHALLQVNEEPAATPASPNVLDSFIDRIDEKAETLSQMRAALADLRTRAIVELRDRA
ncbi:MAG: hypothetical protein OXU39_12530 [Gemmatimonadota bacterium]|nr:hypothetical protein [Gemmatimonadota bacterium]